jgi:hypothetical protein
MGLDMVLPQTRQTWRGKPVRELFAEIIAAHPGANETKLRREFQEAARADMEFLDAIIDYAFDAAFRAYQMQIEKASVTVAARAAAAAKRASDLKTHAARVEFIKEQVVLLNQEMPNGKRARNCTLDYMFRLGGAYRKVGKAGSQKLVGTVYDEPAYRAKLRGLV